MREVFLKNSGCLCIEINCGQAFEAGAFHAEAEAATAAKKVNASELVHPKKAQFVTEYRMRLSITKLILQPHNVSKIWKIPG